jgi:predicted transporter
MFSIALESSDIATVSAVDLAASVRTTITAQVAAAAADPTAPSPLTAMLTAAASYTGRTITLASVATESVVVAPAPALPAAVPFPLVPLVVTLLVLVLFVGAGYFCVRHWRGSGSKVAPEGEPDVDMAVRRDLPTPRRIAWPETETSSGHSPFPRQEMGTK